MRTIACLCLLLAAPAAAAEPAKDPGVRYVRGVFECRLPSRWADSDAWAGPMPLYVFVRAGAREPSPVISIEKYPKGNPLYPTAEAFLAYLSDRTKGRPLKAFVSGRELPLIERLYTERARVVGPREPGAWKIRERLVVLDAPDGFLVLRLKTPDSVFKEVEPDFLEFLKSFRKLEKPPDKKPG